MKYAKKGSLPYTLGAEMGRGGKVAGMRVLGKKLRDYFFPRDFSLSHVTPNCEANWGNNTRSLHDI